jgi:formylmethanofuran dehydrogenase subunit E-like metal-binding protein
LKNFQIDANTYANVTTSLNSYTLQDGTTITQRVTKETQSYYQYEVDLNETKRTIKLIKPEFVPAIEKEFKKVIK